jgi:hypothetical protein
MRLRLPIHHQTGVWWFIGRLKTVDRFANVFNRYFQLEFAENKCSLSLPDKRHSAALLKNDSSFLSTVLVSLYIFN